MQQGGLFITQSALYRHRIELLLLSGSTYFFVGLIVLDAEHSVCV